jgi:Holin of 3TMs, for gene-transfer release
MFGAIAEFITGIFSPVQKIIDRTVTTDKDRLELANELAKVQSEVQNKLIDLQEKALAADVAIRQAELGSNTFLAQNWRPICAIVSFTVLLISAFKPEVHISDKMMDIFQLFLGGYAGGRTLEKVSSTIADAVSKR